LLSLNDGRWSELQSTYGDGRRVARLLSVAAAGTPKDEWYDDLFQELCHQYTVSEAAYAAMPHLVVLARQSEIARKHLARSHWCLLCSAQMPNSRPIPKTWHQSGIPRPGSHTIVGNSLTEDGISETDLRYLLSSITALHGYHSLAYVIEGLDTEIECPNCGALIDPISSSLSMGRFLGGEWGFIQEWRIGWLTTG